MRIVAVDIGGTMIKSGLWNGETFVELRETEVFLRVWNITTGIPKTCFTVSPSAPLPDLPVI